MTEPNTPENYANWLLTTLAKIPPRSVTLEPGVGVPALAPFVIDPTELALIVTLPFRYDQVDATRALATILTAAGYRFWQIWPRDYLMKAVLAVGGGKYLPVRFLIERKWRFAGPITITRIPD